jgi:hypothetical protein
MPDGGLTDVPRTQAPHATPPRTFAMLSVLHCLPRYLGRYFIHNALATARLHYRAVIPGADLPRYRTSPSPYAPRLTSVCDGPLCRAPVRVRRGRCRQSHSTYCGQYSHPPHTSIYIFHVPRTSPIPHPSSAFLGTARIGRGGAASRPRRERAGGSEQGRARPRWLGTIFWVCEGGRHRIST